MSFGDIMSSGLAAGQPLGGMKPAAEILHITPERYHADEIGDGPSLSSSVANLLLSSSPAHAKAAHPRLNPAHAREEEQKFDIGTVAHAILLEGDDVCEVVHHDDWRTNAAKEARDSARAYGKVPLLRKDHERVLEMVDAARRQIALISCDPPLLAAGVPERTITWTEPNGVRCRALIDWLHDDRRAVDDLKTTARSANPEGWTRSTLFSIGADVQIAFYLRGLEALGHRDVSWRYIVVETAPPYALSVISPTPAVLAIGRKKVEYAIDLWRRCLETDTWPGYPTEVCYAELPPWEENRWLEREAREAA